MELRDSVRRVILSEKGSKLSALNQYFLEVDVKAAKPEIRQAGEAQFGVHVLKVRTATIKGGQHAHNLIVPVLHEKNPFGQILIHISSVVVSCCKVSKYQKYQSPKVS